VQGLVFAEPAHGASDAGDGSGREPAKLAFRREAERNGLAAFAIREAEEGPLGAIRHAAIDHDLVVLGRESMLDVNGELCALSLCVDRIIRDEPRPVLLVPEASSTADAGVTEAPVLVAFDDSPASSRTLHMFALLGLADGRTVHVITLDPASERQAEATAARACSLLRHHGAADAHAIGRDAGAPQDAILETAGALGAGMIVMGAYGTRGIREIFGSCTRAVLHAAPVPLFLHH
jgi:nucleotide-binding universal stress UspA family protein